MFTDNYEMIEDINTLYWQQKDSCVYYGNPNNDLEILMDPGAIVAPPFESPNGSFYVDIKFSYRCVEEYSCYFTINVIDPLMGPDPSSVEDYSYYFSVYGPDSDYSGFFETLDDGVDIDVDVLPYEDTSNAVLSLMCVNNILTAKINGVLIHTEELNFHGNSTRFIYITDDLGDMVDSSEDFNLFYPEVEGVRVGEPMLKIESLDIGVML